ncbi:MAG TPA: acyltransferase [Anaerolineales bacterium]|nr:acyltransferase [Anaerolineales bacterium]HNS60991.1 acyltransferase [Anaerolineales bacterium]
MSLETKPRFYLPELDGLRFIAFLLVFIHNANPILKRTFLERFSEYSWFGVDLFFCLSGFLITKLLVMEHRQTGKINFRNFYIRRILKIWPLYFFYLILGSIIIAPVDGRNINLPWHIVSLSTFTFNFAYLALLPLPF